MWTKDYVSDLSEFFLFSLVCIFCTCIKIYCFYNWDKNNALNFFNWLSDKNINQKNVVNQQQENVHSQGIAAEGNTWRGHN